jgi:hypothetical protein
MTQVTAFAESVPGAEILISGVEADAAPGVSTRRRPRWRTRWQRALRRRRR